MNWIARILKQWNKNTTMDLQSRIGQLEKENKKLKRSVELKNAEFRNLVNKIHGITQSDMGFRGEDYENEIPDRQIAAIELLISKY